jgi:hypothetical protein
MAYGNGGLSAGSAIGEVRREGAISSQMNTLGKNSGILHSTIEELEARMVAVLAPQPPPSQTKDPHGVQIPGVQLGASLLDMNERIAHATMRLRALIDRIEL